MNKCRGLTLIILVLIFISTSNTSIAQSDSPLTKDELAKINRELDNPLAKR